MDEARKERLDDDVAFFVSRRALSDEQVRFLRYRLLYMRFADRFPSRPLDVAATRLMDAVRDIDYNYEGIIKSFQKDPTRGYGSANEFDRASRRLVLESWVRSDDNYMTASADEMRFLGGHPTAGMHRPDDVPVLTRQIEMVHNRCASVSSRRRRASFGVFFGRRFAVRLLLDVAPAPARPLRRVARLAIALPISAAVMLGARRTSARLDASRAGVPPLPPPPLEHRQGPRDVGDVAGGHLGREPPRRGLERLVTTACGVARPPRSDATLRSTPRSIARHAASLGSHAAVARDQHTTLSSLASAASRVPSRATAASTARHVFSPSSHRSVANAQTKFATETAETAEDPANAPRRTRVSSAAKTPRSAGGIERGGGGRGVPAEDAA
jgi:hypothetical protein